MKTAAWIVAGIILVIGVGYGAWFWQQRTIDDLNQQVTDLQGDLERAQGTDGGESTETEQPTGYTYTSENDVEVEVYRPNEGEQVSSPLTVMGQVPGSWSFEASFPVELQDAEGNTVAQGAAQMHGDWMTEELVPFTVTLEFAEVPSGEGELILQKANASGLPENDDTVRVPVTF